MDDFNSLTPLFQDDPFFPEYTTIQDNPISNNTILEDMDNHGHPNSVLPSSHEENKVVINTDKRKRHGKPSNIRDNDRDGNEDDNEKRISHRDIERQRRKEMANLYASLGKLLPLEYAKGRRSAADQMHEAVKYVKQMEKNIRELEVKRNELRKSKGESDLDIQNGEAIRSSSQSTSSNIAFTVNSCSDGGIEVLIKSDLADDLFPISRLLNVLLNEGLAVVSCIYTKVDEHFHCTIQSFSVPC